MFDYKDKSKNMEYFKKSMFNKTLTMFDYENLPDTLPFKEMEKLLQINGYVVIAKINNELYALNGSLTGRELDPYNRPTKVIITNNALKFNETLEIGKDCVVISNDDMMLGLIPLFERYGVQIIENEITFLVNGFNVRMQTLISADDDNTVESAKNYLKKIVDGEIGIVATNKMFDGLKVNPANANQNNVITDLIELEQYWKASLYNEIGLNANFNMKRERLNSSEVAMNTDNLYPFIDNMLDNRKIGLQLVNELFDTDIQVEFSSIWELKKEDLENTLETDETIENNKSNNIEEMLQGLYTEVFGSPYNPDSSLEPEDETEELEDEIEEPEDETEELEDEIEEPEDETEELEDEIEEPKDEKKGDK